VFALSLDAESPITIGTHEVVLEQTGSDNFGNYALFSVDEQRMKVYEGNQKSIQGVTIYVDGVSDETGIAYDSAIIFINGAEKSFLGQRFGDYWYQLRKGERITYDGIPITFVDVEDSVTVRVADKNIQLVMDTHTPVQGISLMAHRVERRGSSHELTLRVHTLDTSPEGLQEKTSKVISLGSLEVIQGRMTLAFEKGKSAFGSPFSKLKERWAVLTAKFL